MSLVPPVDSLSPRHHPSDDLLLRHAAGRLPPVPALVVATHLPFCAQCRAAIRLGETVGGVLLADQPAEDISPLALSRAMARLEMPASVADTSRVDSELAPGVPLPASLRGLARPRWRWLAPGISRIAIGVPGAEREERVYLLRVAPGTSLPEHGHSGWEATCVLSGHFTDGDLYYRRGDVAEMDDVAIHQPVSGQDAGCICLIACQGPLRLRGVIARLMQPFVGV
jgi:putative transcriptional regulator